MVQPDAAFIQTTDAVPTNDRIMFSTDDALLVIMTQATEERRVTAIATNAEATPTAEATPAAQEIDPALSTTAAHHTEVVRHTMTPPPRLNGRTRPIGQSLRQRILERGRQRGCSHSPVQGATGATKAQIVATHSQTVHAPTTQHGHRLQRHASYGWLLGFNLVSSCLRGTPYYDPSFPGHSPCSPNTFCYPLYHTCQARFEREDVCGWTSHPRRTQSRSLTWPGMLTWPRRPTSPQSLT